MSTRRATVAEPGASARGASALVSCVWERRDEAVHSPKTALAPRLPLATGPRCAVPTSIHRAGVAAMRWASARGSSLRVASWRGATLQRRVGACSLFAKGCGGPCGATSVCRAAVPTHPADVARAGGARSAATPGRSMSLNKTSGAASGRSGVCVESSVPHHPGSGAPPSATHESQSKVNGPDHHNNPPRGPAPGPRKEV